MVLEDGAFIIFVMIFFPFLQSEGFLKEVKEICGTQGDHKVDQLSLGTRHSGGCHISFL